MTQAEKAENMSKRGEPVTAGVLRESFGAGWNPNIGRWEFPDGSTGKFSTDAVQNNLGKFGYPFQVAAKPLEFPDAVTDASVESKQTIVRNERGEPIRAILPGEAVPEYTGEHSTKAIYGTDRKAVVTGDSAPKNPRKAVSMKSERVETAGLDGDKE